LSSTDQSQQKERPPLTAQDIRSWKWVPRYFMSIIGSTDAVLFLGGGLLVGLLAELYRRVQTDGSVELFAIAALGVAALAVTLTALSIFVSLVNDTYLRILALNRESGGIAGFVVPYIVSALVSALAVLVGTIGAVVYAAVPRWADATFLGVGAGLALWATWGLFQITVSAAIHGLNRYRVAQDQFAMADPDISDLLDQSGENASQVSGPASESPASEQGQEKPEGSGRPEPEAGSGGGSSTLAVRRNLQSSLISWIPPLVLVFGLALILQLYSQHSLDLGRGVSALDAKSPEVWIFLILSVLVAGILTRAFELAALHFLEGRWGSSPILNGFAGLLIRRQVRRLRHLERRYRQSSMSAFYTARPEMLEKGIERNLVAILEEQLLGRPSSMHKPQELAQAVQIDWRSFAPANSLRQMDAILSRMLEYPSPNRILPTRLGNIIRSAEERVPRADKGVDDPFLGDFLFGQRYEQHSFLGSLIAASSLLTVISWILVIVSIVILVLSRANLHDGVALVVANAGLALVSYFATISVARIYTLALRIPGPRAAPDKTHN
jgi:hypothetical protein